MRTALWRVGPLLVVVASILAGAVPAAHAGKSVDSNFGSYGEGAGQFVSLAGLAVNQATGQVYAADDGTHRIQRFAGDGGFERAWGWDVQSFPAGMPAFEICGDIGGDVCQAAVSGNAAGQLARPDGVAVDPVTGEVYVAEASQGTSAPPSGCGQAGGCGNRVSKFTADGEFLFAFGWGVDTGAGALETCTALSGCQGAARGSGAGQFAAAFDRDVAVDPVTRNVVVTDPGNRRVQVFTSSGDFVRAFGWGVDTGAAALETCTAASGCQAGIVGAGVGQFASLSPTSVVVDSASRIYVVDAGNQRVQRFAASGGSPEIFAAAELSGGTGPESLAISSDDRLFVGVRDSAASERQIKEVDAAGTLVDTHMVGTGIDSPVLGLALREATGRLYVGMYADDQSRVLILDDDGAAAATAIVENPTAVTAHTVDLEAVIDPNGGTASYRFQIYQGGAPPADQDDWIDVGAGGSVAGDVGVPVSETATDLEANRPYVARVVATKPFGGPTTASSPVAFSTPIVPPEPVTGPVRDRTATSVKLAGRVNANNLPTTYYFEYGQTAAYGAQVPVEPASAGMSGQPVSVLEHLQGLEPGATYHYRLVATNSQGTVHGDDRTFTTRDLVEPPAGRAYEMVTRPYKNNRRSQNNKGVEVALGNPGAPSPDGNSLLFRFHVGILDPDAGTAFPFVDETVIMRREEAGWKADPVNNIPSAVGATGGLDTPVGLAADFSVLAWQHNAELFYPESSGLSTRVLGDTGGFQGTGWYDWIPDTSVPSYLAVSGDRALVDDAGARMVRWSGSGGYRGLLGPEDPSNQQLAGPDGGAAVYFQEPPGSGARLLVNECTGDGETSTHVPLRDDNGTPSDFADDHIGGQTCEAGSVVSRQGAVVGGGGGAAVGEESGPAATAMSEDGTRILFMSPDPGVRGIAPCRVLDATNAPALGENTDCPPQLFVRQRGTSADAVRWLSRPMVANQAVALLGPSVFEGASRDGRTVYFRTNSPLTADDPNATGGTGPVTTGVASQSSWDLYRYTLPASADSDPADGVLTRISGGPGAASDSNVMPESGSGSRYVSDDGDRAYFVTAAPLVGADTTPPAGGATVPDGTPSTTTHRNLYLYDDTATGAARWRFVARLPSAAHGRTDACATRSYISGMPLISSSAAQVTERQRFVNCVRGTPDGRSIVFETNGRLTEDDDDEAGDIYVYDAEKDELTRVSAPPLGATPYVCGHDIGSLTPNEHCNADLGYDGPFTFPDELIGLGGRRQTNLAMGPDGRLSAIFFESRVPLVPADQNGTRMDAYQWRAGELSLISPGSTDDDAYYSGNSRNGSDVFFHTSQRIDPREVEDADFDMYDARVGGGFPLPPAPQPPCDPLADACQDKGRSGGVPPRETENPNSDGNAKPGARVRLALKRPNRRVLRRAARTGSLPVAVRTTRAGRVTIVARARVRARNGRLVLRAVARRNVRLRTASTARVRLKLSSPARRQLRRTGRLRLTIVVKQGGARPLSSSIVLRRAGK
jgi:hypothetical protein